MGAALKLIIFIITNLPALIKALKDIFNLIGGDKKAAKVCLDEICNVDHLKMHADRNKVKKA